MSATYESQYPQDDHNYPEGVPSDSEYSQEFHNQSIERDHYPDITHEETLDGLVEMLANLDCGLPLLLDKTKLCMLSYKDLVLFLKKRAMLEEEYGKGMLKLTQQIAKSAEKSDIKVGTFGDSWGNFIKYHEAIGENRVKFASTINEVGDNLSAAYKEHEKSRRQLKENGLKLQKHLHEAESNLEKAKIKYSMQSEEWEHAILKKGSDSIRQKGTSITKSVAKPMNIFKQNKSSDQVEEDARQKANTYNENYKSQLAYTNKTRHEYHTVELPRILKSLKDVAYEAVISIQYHLAKYAFHLESTILEDGIIIAPLNEDGGSVPDLRSLVDQIDSEADLKDYIRKRSTSGNRVEKSEIPYNEYALSAAANSIINPRNIFGVDLAYQLDRDHEPIPPILLKCAEAIERFGINSTGIYRISGTIIQIQKFRTLFNRDSSQVDLSSDDKIGDINNITGVLKLYFRELPEPLFTASMANEFINAAMVMDEMQCLSTMSQLMNYLPPPNYRTMRYLFAHLLRIQANQARNMMSIQNLAIVFGPTLLANRQDKDINVDMSYQSKVVEVMLENFQYLFAREPTH
ncbi:RhoGAP-domain-containing protein [Basidiobolus meristosporus CBS 931.73]|uniref:RhoGAP-domain-containing protein n=1 Tax=Basidiobolus meristosporus CBS 931.73 TaxID=1314790 RepID=A0A1Y1XVQ3_9FUNG|nr:RhoGAP-domain-containing protein [Basidiobolus meristosporus CBS 931.73]|eukprot:ORX89803.1 RhoGAP-domain-containing protein [Basidiobolus meristosporus CBS 931.73]